MDVLSIALTCKTSKDLFPELAYVSAKLSLRSSLRICEKGRKCSLFNKKCYVKEVTVF